MFLHEKKSLFALKRFAPLGQKTLNNTWSFKVKYYLHTFPPLQYYKNHPSVNGSIRDYQIVFTIKIIVLTFLNSNFHQCLIKVFEYKEK